MREFGRWGPLLPVVWGRQTLQLLEHNVKRAGITIACVPVYELEGKETFVKAGHTPYALALDLFHLASIARATFVG